MRPDGGFLPRDGAISTRNRLRLLVRPRPIALGLTAASVAALAMAVPTAVLANPFFTRMTPVRTLDYVFWAIGSVLIGLIVATYAVPGVSAACQSRTLASGVVNVLAIGCPICNKVVVLLLGISGALTIWAPLQPLLGIGALAVLSWTLTLRLRLLRQQSVIAAA